MTDLVDIRPDHLRIVQDVLRDHLPAGVEVWVFGSRAQWSAREGSDLDLALEGETELARTVLDALNDAFEESDLPYTVDVVDINRVNERIRQIVKGQWIHLTSGSQWLDCTLADACDTIDYGLTASASDKPDGPRFLRITDIVSGPIDWDSVPYVAAGQSTTAKYRLNDGDIVIARTGASTGSSAYIKNPPTAVFASYLVRLVAKPEFDSRFLAYYLQSPNFKAYINGVLGDKSAQPNASASTMTKAPLYAPRSKSEQRAIANVLGALDDGIELNRRMSETLEEMARALFKSWFVDFDPVRAKIEGHWRRGESLPGLPGEMYDLFPARLVESELGGIPEGWEVEPLGDLIDLAYGKALKAGNRKAGDIPVYGSNGQVGWHDEQLVAGPGVIVGRKGNPGTITWASSDFYPIDTAFYVIPKNEKLGLHFLFYALAEQDLSTMAADSAVPGLNRNLAYMNRQLVPDKTVTDIFCDYSDSILARRHWLYEHSHTLEAQRDVLLPMLMSGRLGKVDSS